MQPRKKIALIRTPIVQPYYHISGLRAVPSVGLAYINASIKNAGYETIIIDSPGEALKKFTRIKHTSLSINGLSAKEILNRIPPDVSLIAISVMHQSEWIYDSYLIRQIGLTFPGIPILIGGENATGSSDQILREHPEIKAIVLGEGDKIAPLAIDAILSHRPLESVQGLAFHGKDDNIIRTKRRENISSLDSLPSPDWDGFPLENYFKEKTGISIYSERSIPLLATRGCPHTCTFCTVPNMWNSKWSPREPENVVHEIKEYIERYKVEHLDFVDLTFAQSKSWVQSFCRLLIDKQVNIRWSLPIGTRVENLDYETLLLMKQSGCQRILFSPESGSKLTLKRIKKRLEIDKMSLAIKNSVNVGLIIKIATIFGFPGQTKMEVLQTLIYIVKSALVGVHDVVCLAFTPYPGTELFDQLVDKNVLIPGKSPVRLNNDLPGMISWSDHIPSWSMKFISLAGMASFYFIQFAIRPYRLYLCFKRVFRDKRPQTNLESIIYCFFFKVSTKISDEVDLAKNIRVTNDHYKIP